MVSIEKNSTEPDAPAVQHIESTVKRTRRKEARPLEIVAAATVVFASKGFAGTRLEDIAKHAGVAKGTLYRYFEDKDTLFRAVAKDAMTKNLELINSSGDAQYREFDQIVPHILLAAATQLSNSNIPAIARMVIAESKAFPDLAEIWNQEVAAQILDVLVRVIVLGQKKGQIRSGDPTIHAYSIIGPMIFGMLNKEVFGNNCKTPDIRQLAFQHAETAVQGLMINTKEG